MLFQPFINLRQLFSLLPLSPIIYPVIQPPWSAFFTSFLFLTLITKTFPSSSCHFPKLLTSFFHLLPLIFSLKYLIFTKLYLILISFDFLPESQPLSSSVRHTIFFTLILLSWFSILLPFISFFLYLTLLFT
jgi:hypothetical protein